MSIGLEGFALCGGKNECSHGLDDRAFTVYFSLLAQI